MTFAYIAYYQGIHSPNQLVKNTRRITTLNLLTYCKKSLNKGAKYTQNNGIMPIK
ncbi:hypothetical protein XSR1_70019 [Xenorhabdus szentirmaii DSM 16338]|uniref:Uncharacterized protein n=1 Tax=Xenorhabdus szentirmaii DSM 16338 TaxID=1427518 RepID=W1J5C7_9GAMM|nr:hypothetical protein XSR1_70019 [Xenorhabdus szentirmaii DSM 16338]